MHTCVTCKWSTRTNDDYLPARCKNEEVNQSRLYFSPGARVYGILIPCTKARRVFGPCGYYGKFHEFRESNHE